MTNNIIQMKNKNNHSEEVLIARFAKALGHPTRIAILQFLAKQEKCFFGEIHEELPIAKATVSQHLKELKEAGLIQGEIEGPKVKYCINQVNWDIANKAFKKLFQECRIKDICC
ncbi:MAG: HTH-type transcriptional regulator CmtR [Bacteroidetes bacterium ADurb.Bin234]|nr:MAG: HTH-type transcriptional regulator CmtR [Bacteroidetes bacterium ADurb.Bin234]